ncbi:alpha-hydroxy acid oxidase [Chelativorans sp. M5D2P16]|uniref:alpha-hydroxy acid oxidase n=1 Tax=Chelativorans sp. M5D2P16 TaxID=3095678 RepID=UPI002ACA2F11|nr:alpha-hydroxy acid oxidase [Chelativorans sp. M5D2P16]MDZ5699529.1 alpha-hydroxy acid oxidase [Chelativorans sp. M5D2P16]
MAAKSAWGPGSKSGRAARLTYAAPTYEFLEKRARRRVPGFAFDFVQGGTGADWGVDENRRVLDAVQIVPRYGELEKVETGVEIYGRRYDVPIGIAPTGMDALIWPGSTMALAKAAAHGNIPYITGTLANSTLEEVAEVAGGNTWLQLYGFPREDHRVTFDLIARAKTAGVSAIVATLDAPVRAKRPRDLHNRLVVPFRPTPRTVWQVATAPHWALALLRNGMPRFANIDRYVDGRPTLDNVAGFVQRELKGTFSWEEIARMRREWDGALLVKGVLHPDDAEEAVKAGADGILVSNHGGRQSDAAPSPVDVLPGIRDRVDGRTDLFLDSGVRSGLDAVRAMALGARAVFCGRAYLYALAALGDGGGAHFADLIREEFAVAMAQSGAWSPAGLGDVTFRHPGAFDFGA